MFDIASNRNGHYCRVCARHRANEKFNGKGHRKHICKDCMKKDNTLMPEDRPAETHGVQYYKKRIGSNLILCVDDDFLFLFVYEGRFYAANPEKDESVVQFIKNSDLSFVKTSEFADSPNFQEALWEKYYARLESGNLMDSLEYLDCYEGVEESAQVMQKKQRIFLDLVVGIDRQGFSWNKKGLPVSEN